MIKYSIRGGNIGITDTTHNYIESKLGKIEKCLHAEQDLDARVNLKIYREKTTKVEVTILVGSITLRAEDISRDIYGSVDLVADRIERQIRKNRTKITRKYRERSPASQVFTSEFEAESVKEGPVVGIIYTKHVSLEPMNVDEAFLQVNLLGHDFFIYAGAENGVTNVLYRREGDELSLIKAK